MVYPAPNRFVRDRDSAFRQQIFNVAEAQSESNQQSKTKQYPILKRLSRIL
jgi:hypothetical protein